MLQYEAVFKGHHYGYVLKNHNPKADDLFFSFSGRKAILPVKTDNF
ncbi:hypothetical protein DB29_02286 [Shouchella clausii]|nr:hypothetical protein DB29_02286 [Shouchella clausii]